MKIVRIFSDLISTALSLRTWASKGGLPAPLSTPKLSPAKGTTGQADSSSLVPPKAATRGQQQMRKHEVGNGRGRRVQSPLLPLHLFEKKSPTTAAIEVLPLLHNWAWARRWG